MSAGHPRMVLVYALYPELLRWLYEEDPTLAELDFEPQRRRVQSRTLSAGHAYAHYLRVLGCEADEIIVNADRMQRQWAKEHGVTVSGDRRQQQSQIASAQIAHDRPDVLFVFEWCPLGDAFLAHVKPYVRRLVGQVASPLPPARTYAAYDLMISSWPPIVDHFRKAGVDADALPLGFDPRVMTHLPQAAPCYDATFVGGFAPSHPDRIPWLETLIEHVALDLFGYGVETTPPDSPIRRHHHGPVWGRRMYEVLHRSRVTLNRHARIEVGSRAATEIANNMRLYEATGVGTCLITERKGNLAEMFEPDREVVTYTDASDCVDKIRYYLTHEAERLAIARAGRRRTLHDHTYATRMSQLLDILKERL